MKYYYQILLLLPHRFLRLLGQFHSLPRDFLQGRQLHFRRSWRIHPHCCHLPRARRLCSRFDPRRRNHPP